MTAKQNLQQDSASRPGVFELMDLSVRKESAAPFRQTEVMSVHD